MGKNYSSPLTPRTLLWGEKQSISVIRNIDLPNNTLFFKWVRLISKATRFGKAKQFNFVYDFFSYYFVYAFSLKEAENIGDTMELKKLSYKIHNCSGHLSNYVPENIMIDDPTDQSSRWSTNTNTPPQFLTIKLDRPAIVKTISFGKYNKSHVCNLKKFIVVGGMQDSNFTELLAGGLENNNVQEMFPIRYKSKAGLQFPVQYISILPQQAWGPSFNYCLWYLELKGVDHIPTVRSVLYKFNLQAEQDTIRICLKHLRQQRYTAAFAALQRETGVRLEAPPLERLYALLVEQGDFAGAEDLLQEAGKEGLFEWYASRQPYSAAWSNIIPCSPSLAERLGSGGEGCPCPAPPPPPTSRPGQRGGHQLCMDPDSGMLYLFGGWNGESDLSDLWSYTVQDDKWTLIYRQSEHFSGPYPRSCHKMVLDSGRRQIFLLGRYLDVKHRTTQNMKSDLYVFDIAEGVWCKLCEDTGGRGGPRLIFDHQMCVDSQRHILYVFGGKILSMYGETDENQQYSGLYSYHIAEDRWSLLLPDAAASLSHQHSILSRASHSMLFHPVTRILYVFGGQRHKEHLADLLAVSVGEEIPKVRPLCQAPPRRAPPPGFNHRATIDTNLNEIYVLAGISKEDKRVSNSLWVFSLSRLQWSCVYKNDNQGHNYWAKMQLVEPCPRFAHQLVYDQVGKVHYLFGGNPGQSSQPSLRLDDFWQLRLSRLSSEAAWRMARLCLRRLQYEELVRAGRSRDALTFLQTRLHQATNHSSREEAKQFQLMATLLFAEKEQTLFFHPPLEPLENKETALVRRDPEIPDESQPKNGDYSMECTDKYPDAEQQALFATMLGMDSLDESSTSIVPQPGEEDVEPTSTAKMIASIQDEILQDKCDDYEKHYRRCQLFQELSEYFPLHMVQPAKNLTDFSPI